MKESNDYDFNSAGKHWFWDFALVCTVIGFVCVGVWTVEGIIWLINQFK